MDETMTLTEFMAGNAITVEPVDYVASKRFVKNGKPIPWKLQAISNDRIDALTKRYTKYVPIKGTRETKKEFDSLGYMEALALETIVYPNLDDAELQASYNAIGALELVKTMLTPGEWYDLQMACSEANGYQSGMEDKIKTAKN